MLRLEIRNTQAFCYFLFLLFVHDNVDTAYYVIEYISDV
jgi:hypothetical protein